MKRLTFFSKNCQRVPKLDCVREQFNECEIYQAFYVSWQIKRMFVTLSEMPLEELNEVLQDSHYTLEEVAAIYYDGIAQEIISPSTCAEILYEKRGELRDLADAWKSKTYIPAFVYETDTNYAIIALVRNDVEGQEEQYKQWKKELEEVAKSFDKEVKFFDAD